MIEKCGMVSYFIYWTKRGLKNKDKNIIRKLDFFEN